MPKLNIKMFLILIIILIILFILALFLPSYLNQKSITNNIQQTIPTPTLVQVIPSKQPGPTLIEPTSTGGQEDIPKNVEDSAAQKQNLRRKTPFQGNGFMITFDYANDQFIVALQQPTTTNQELFKNWLKQNYPLIPLNKFLLK